MAGIEDSGFDNALEGTDTETNGKKQNLERRKITDSVMKRAKVKNHT